MAKRTLLQAEAKQPVSSSDHRSRSGLWFRPPVDIFETEQAITVLADMPGVTADDISVELNKNMLTIAGRMRPWEEADEADVLVEFEIGHYFRQFIVSESIDRKTIEANLSEGVLRLTLPKAESAVSRKIIATSS